MFVEKNLNYKNLKLIILFLILIVSFWRSPYIFFNGRFIGEEATHHFLYALENSFLKNLFYYDVFAGYINLLPNLLLWVSTKLPIDESEWELVSGSMLSSDDLPILSSAMAAMQCKLVEIYPLPEGSSASLAILRVESILTSAKINSSNMPQKLMQINFNKLGPSSSKNDWDFEVSY